MKETSVFQKGSDKVSEQNTPKANLIKLAVDMAKRNYVVVRQTDNGPIQPPQRFTPAGFEFWAEKQRTLAKRVVVCYEAGPFGYVLARKLKKMQVECLVMAPIKLDERNRRVNTDKSDARQIAIRLDRYLAGNSDALHLVQPPTELQEQERAEARQYGQLLETRKTIRLQAKSLLLTQGYDLTGSWWKPRCWKKCQQQLPAWLVEMLEAWRGLLLTLDEQIDNCVLRLEQAAEKTLPAGLDSLPISFGKLTWELLRREVCDWNRFHNRRGPANMTGLCASESSTGEMRQQGPVSKYGNWRLRALLVEAAWRLVRSQPLYKPVVYWWKRVLGHPQAGRGARKKAIVALARRLMVDLWRLATGQTSAAKLGLLLQGRSSDRALSKQSAVLLGTALQQR
jgi:transposase